MPSPKRPSRSKAAVAALAARITAERESKPAAPAPQRIDRAGRGGWRWPDGAVLWDDGEKEVPTSGLSDEAKRAMARAEVDDAKPEKTGPSQAEIADLERKAGALAEPEHLLARRRAAAKEAASRKPGSQSEGVTAMPPSRDESESDLRRQARRLLEREIDRLEELKELAIAGRLELWLDGARLSRNNPPMQLHNAIIAAMRVSDSGPPAAMVKLLHDLAGWKGAAPRDETLPYPPPDGVGPTDLPVNTVDLPAGTLVRGDGGQSGLPPVTPAVREADPLAIPGEPDTKGE